MTTVLKSAEQFMSSIGLQVKKKYKFNRSKLPTPESFWASHGIAFNSRFGWISAKCVFHDDTHASFSINVETGGFFCHACSAKGGDVLDAYRLLNECDFVTAAKALGAWEEK